MKKMYAPFISPIKDRFCIEPVYLVSDFEKAKKKYCNEKEMLFWYNSFRDKPRSKDALGLWFDECFGVEK